MNKKEFYKFIERGALEGVCRYFEYWFVYNNVPKGSKMLEIGAGRSALAQSLKEKGEIEVIDIDKGAIVYQLSYGIKTHLATDILELKEKFDVVIAVSALEHFDDDLQAIKSVHSILKDGGLFIVTIPVGLKYVENEFANFPNHPRARIYDEETYKYSFLNEFEEVKRSFYKTNTNKATDFVPHKGWGNKTNFEKVDGFDDGVGMCVILKKK